nr:GNAT family N-acetyltransferase [Paenibacillus shirakamiensis]
MLNWQRILDPVNIACTYVAEYNGDIVGFINGGPNREHYPEYGAEVYAFYIDDDYQGRGLGTLLLQKLAEEFMAQNYGSLMVWVLELNPAVQFYKKLGAVFIAKEQIQIGEDVVTEQAYGWTDIYDIAAYSSSKSLSSSE